MPVSAMVSGSVHAQYPCPAATTDSTAAVLLWQKEMLGGAGKCAWEVNQALRAQPCYLFYLTMIH